MKWPKGRVLHTVVVASLSVLPGTPPRPLAQRMADTLLLLPTPSAALIAPVEVPADIVGRVRAVAESQEMAIAAADFAILVARIYYWSEGPPADPLELAVTVKELWEQHVVPHEAGLTGVSMIPAGDPIQWLYAVRAAPWVAETTDHPPGLLVD